MSEASKSLTLKEIKELKKDLLKKIAAEIEHFNSITKTQIKSIIPRYIKFNDESGSAYYHSLNRIEMEIDYER
jgi:hypothetical protein